MPLFTAILFNEIIKVMRRPRSFIGFAVVRLTCLILQGAFYSDGREVLSFVTQQIHLQFDIQGNPLNGNLICFIILQTLIVQMPLLVALVTGDLVSGENTQGTIRTLLSAPASRTQIIVAKWLAGLFYTFLLLLLLGVLALGVSHLIFGSGDLMYINSESITVVRADDVSRRWIGAFLVAFLSLSVIASLSIMLSTIMDILYTHRQCHGYV
jgi:hypothetical protein